jgi:DNA-binding XRE family transcriptional regulator
MPAKPAFTEAQYRILKDTAGRIRKRFKNQEDMALALAIAQPSLSALLKGKWKPGVTTAKAIANLDHTTLEELVGPYGESDGQVPASASGQTFANLEVCVRFHAGTKTWSPWTLAAARAGFWGDSDLPPPAWPERLDMLEKTLDRLRKTQGG